MLDGSVLRYLRKRAELTLGEVGVVNATHLSEVECGRKVPKLDTLERILGAYGYELHITAQRSGNSGELIYKLNKERSNNG
jgi:transcriptional regulator with XRE-family HTH domain